MPATEHPVCAHPGCDRRTWSKHGLCSNHQQGLQREKATTAPDATHVAAPPQPAPQATQSDAGKPDTAPDEAISISLNFTEAQCDALYRRCTPEQKAVALTAALQSALTAGVSL